jgi:hypothetical protein
MMAVIARVEPRLAPFDKLRAGFDKLRASGFQGPLVVSLCMNREPG